MKLATWNVNSLAVRLPQVLQWLAEPTRWTCWCCRKPSSPTTSFRQPRSKPPATARPGSARRPTTAWRCCRRHRPSDVVRNIPGFDDEQARVIAGTVGGVRVIGGYFPNGQAPDSDKFHYKMRWLQRPARLAAHRAGDAPAAGADGRLQHRPGRPRRLRPRGLGRADSLHARRARALPRLVELGLVDAFRLFEQPPKSWSWWDYRNLAFRKNQGLRIDHILVSEALRRAWQPAPSTSCRARTSGPATTRR